MIYLLSYRHDGEHIEIYPLDRQQDAGTVLLP